MLFGVSDADWSTRRRVLRATTGVVGEFPSLDVGRRTRVQGAVRAAEDVDEVGARVGALRLVFLTIDRSGHSP